MGECEVESALRSHCRTEMLRVSLYIRSSLPFAPRRGHSPDRPVERARAESESLSYILQKQIPFYLSFNGHLYLMSSFVTK